MSFIKFAKFDSEILDVKSSKTQQKTANLDKLAEFDGFRTENDYLYVRIRAISSRINQNMDSWASVELAGSPEIFNQHRSAANGAGFTIQANRDAKFGFSTFLGKPIFVDHNNSDPSRARGVVVDAKLHVDDHKIAALDPFYSSPEAEDYHLPPTWVELLLEVDAKSFPKFAKAIIEGARDPKQGIDGFSMGANIRESFCNICGNKAEDSDQFCDHIKIKGARFNCIDPKTGKKVYKRAAEKCAGIGFFEISGVFQPADETALTQELITSIKNERPHRSSKWNKTLKTANLMQEPRTCPKCGGTFDPDHAMACTSCGFSQRVADLGFEPEDPPEYDINRQPQERRFDMPCAKCGTSGIDIETGGECRNCGGTGSIGEAQAMPRGDITGLIDRDDPSKYQPMPEPLSDALYNQPRNNATYSALPAEISCPECQGMNPSCQFCQGQGSLNAPNVGNEGVDMPHNIGPYLTGPGQGEQSVMKPLTFPNQLRNQGSWNDLMKTAEITPGQYNVNAPGNMPGQNGQTRINGVCPNCKEDGYLVDDPQYGIGCNACGWGATNDAPPYRDLAHGASLKTAEAPLPQSDMLSVPEKVDTLRKEEVCEVCGSKRDHGKKCEVCGESPKPDSLDNPDLAKAKELSEQNDPNNGTQIEGFPEAQDISPPPRVTAPNFQAAAHTVISDMEWDFFHPKLGMGKINPIERPVLPTGAPATNDPVREIVISQPSGPVISKTAAQMIAAVKQQENQMETKTADAASGAPAVATPDVRTEVIGVGGVMDASNEAASKADSQVDVLGIGGVDADVSSDHDSIEQSASGDGDDSGFNTDKTTEDSGPTITWTLGEGGATEAQHDPITSEPFPASEDGVKRSAQHTALDANPFPEDHGPDLAGGGANKGTQPADPVGNAEDRVDVLDAVTTPESNNSGPTKTWSGTGGNSILRQQEPVTNETLVGDEGVKAASFTPHIVNAMKLADLEIDMGVLSRDDKYNRLAALAETDPAILAAQLQTLSRVKTAGLRKTPSIRTAGRVPSFNKAASASQPAQPSAVSYDEQLFM